MDNSLLKSKHQINFTVEEIAKLLECEIIGDHKIELCNISSLNSAVKSDISFCYSNKYLKDLLQCNAGAIITSQFISDKYPRKSGCYLVADNPRESYAKCLKLFNKKHDYKPGISNETILKGNVRVDDTVSILGNVYIGEESDIGENTVIFPGTFIGENVIIGKNCIIYANNTIYRDCIIGDCAIIHSNTVIGADGFGFIPDESNLPTKIPHSGRVVIGNNVEIGAGCCIDRGTVGDTVIQDGCKFDNLIQVGHNVKIEKGTLIAGQTGVSGSVEIGSNTIIGGQVAISDHVKIGHNCKIAGRSGVTKDIPDNQTYSGFPARKHEDWLRTEGLIKMLPDIRNRLKKLEGKLM